jgi:HPt (histidine-containing phosphotransfer) domain-containing protein
MDENRQQKMAAVKARVAELAARFITRSMGDLRKMRCDLSKLGAGDASAAGEIQHLAHRMAGTGATLGFEALGERAAGIEAIIDALPDGVPPDAQTIARLAADISALESQLSNDAHRG